MKRCLILFTALLVSTAPPAFTSEPGRLASFEDVLKSLTGGDTVRVVIRYARCHPQNSSSKVPDAIGGMPLEIFEHFAKGAAGNPQAYLAASHTVLIQHPRYGTVLNYARVSLFEDGSVEINARYLDPRSFKVKMDATYLGMLDDGANKGAASFFASR